MTQQRAEPFWTIPNIITLYRIIIFPFILYLVLSGKQHLFGIFITISLITDILDGLIARLFNQQTKIGILLDSWADTGTYILAFLAIYVFKWQDMKPHSLIFIFFLIILIISYALTFIKFKGLIGLHTYMFKVTGYIQGAFIVILFMFGFYTWLFYVAMIWGSLACVEEIIIILMLKQMRSNVKGLYWLIKNGYQ